jgi:hypothetical protein
VQSLPLLRSLCLFGCRNIVSFSFLTSGPITSKLAELTLLHFQPPLPISELHHLRQLRSLERLQLHHVFERELTAEEAAPFTPPSHLMPALRHFTYKLG